MPYVNDTEPSCPLSFTELKEERERCEGEDVQDNWVELRSIVRDIYVCTEEPVLVQEQEKRLKFLVDKCTCDECTITHRITCGIINSDIGGEHTPNAFNFALDHTRNVMDITPPSMSSTTSSSGSVSPITIDDKLTTFYDHRDEFSDALLNCEDREGKAMSLNADTNFENGEDEEADDEDEGDEDEYCDMQNAGSDEPHSIQDPAFLLEAMHDQREHLRQQHVFIERLNHHSCSHQQAGKNVGGCPFQPPINQKLSRELDAEIARSGILSKGLEELASSDIIGIAEESADSKSGSSGDMNNGSLNPTLCAACQCHACLKQSGHVVSTSLPLQVAASPSPADLHLYPHIHGLPQQDPKNYMLPHLMSSIKLPVKIDFDDTSGLQELCSDWDSKMQPRPGSLAAQHQHQHHHRLSSHSSNLLPPPTLDPAVTPFTFDFASHLATHTTHTSTTNTTSAFKSLSGKHFASSIMPALSNVGNITSEGSSVDPTRPLDFTSLVKIPQSCLNGTGSFPASPFPVPTLSVSSSSTLSSVSGAPVTSSITTAKVNGTCQGPPCSRPTPLGGNASTSKWEKGHLQHCKKFTGVGHPNKQQLLPGAVGQQHHSQHNLSSGSLAGSTQPFSSTALKNLFPNHHQQKEDSKGKNGPLSSIAASSGLRPGGISSQSEGGVGRPAPAVSSTNGPPGSAQGPASNNSSVNNIGVGTVPCNDPECEVHNGEDNCDSVDDSCSEKSSSTTTSNQKEGKYCDCCYCEFFGHNNGTSAKTSTNYIETKDRLRKKLKNRQSEGKNGMKKDLCNDNTHDPLEKKGLEGLLRFINGTDDVSECKTKAKEISAKAAKRARQKQKKMEEKAKFEETFHQNPAEAIQFLRSQQPTTPGSEINIVVSRCKKETAYSKKEAQLDRPQEADKASLSSKSIGCVSQVPVSGIGSGSKILTSSKEILKPNTATGQHQQDKQCQQQCTSNRQVEQTSQPSNRGQKGQQHLQKQQGHQKQQLPTGRTVNGSSSTESPVSKMSSPSKNRTTPNYKPYPLSTASNGMRNGQVVNSFCDISSKPNPVTTLHPTPAVTGPVNKTVVIDSPGTGTGSGSSASQSPSCGTKTDQGKTNAKSKKKKKNKNGGISCVDEIFMPKSESELDGDVDDFERELEEFKRFCFEPAEPRERRKIAVNVNLKDIFKKKTGLV
ncbi:family with sequence similarity 193, member A [Elysia marginata]|uniref:Family with sequence similarity 193, member A n=1 Tax=Elysia marginata TaxID=1093978 RepID=A0AAV4F5X8_9GAST|nr:family with sequence similarity 193, member A [Elysia marginata]